MVVHDEHELAERQKGAGGAAAGAPAAQAIGPTGVAGPTGIQGACISPQPTPFPPQLTTTAGCVSAVSAAGGAVVVGGASVGGGMVPNTTTLNPIVVLHGCDGALTAASSAARASSWLLARIRPRKDTSEADVVPHVAARRATTNDTLHCLNMALVTDCLKGRLITGP